MMNSGGEGFQLGGGEGPSAPTPDEDEKKKLMKKPASPPPDSKESGSGLMGILESANNVAGNVAKQRKQLAMSEARSRSDWNL